MKKLTKDVKTQRSIRKLSENLLPNWVFHLVFVLIGLVLILMGTISFANPENQEYIPSSVKTLLVSIGQALLVGMCISFILDLPFMKHYYRNRIIDVLVSDEYLDELSKDRLEKLRSEVTEKLYINDTEHHDETLIQLDQRITKFLSQPYYEYYRCDIVVAKQDDGNLFKTTVIKYKLVNPKGSRQHEELKGRVWLHRVEGKGPEELYKVKRLKVKVDNSVEKDLIKDMCINHETPIDQDTNYDYQFVIHDKDGMYFSIAYERTLEIEIVDERIMPSYDNIYVKRTDDNPIKSFLVSFKTTGMDCRLEGTCLGTLSKVSAGDIRVVKQDASIAIECFSWMLPGNGIMIAILPNNIEKYVEKPPNLNPKKASDEQNQEVA